MTQLDIRRIITKYLNQEATPEEMTLLYNWVKKGNNQEAFKKFVQADFLTNYKNRTWESEEAFKKFLESIKEKEYKKPLTLYSGQAVWKYAAVILLLIVSGASIFLPRDSQHIEDTLLGPDQITLQLDNGEVIGFDPDQDATIMSRNGSTKVSWVKGVLSQQANDPFQGASRMNVLRVPFGKSLSLTLSDGSSVKLNAGSTLRYPTSFTGQDKREVELEGEGFFEVAKHPKQPFVVRAGQMYTRVFGTVFNVSAYGEDNGPEVVLVEGSVGVGLTEGAAPEDLQLLEPSQKASRALDGGRPLVVEKVDVSKYISWTQGVLLFDNEEMSEIIKKLQRKFNIQIINKHEGLAKRRFTGQFNGENLDRILRTIQSHTHFDYSRDGNIITMTEPTKQ